MPYSDSTEIAMRAIDIDDLRDSDDIPEGVSFSILLSDTPNPDWVQEFMHYYEIARNPIKPPVRVEDDRLWVCYLPRYAPDLPGYLDFLKSIVDRANTEELRTAHLHQSDPLGQKSRFREVLKEIRLP